MRIDLSYKTITQLRAFTTSDVLYNPVVIITDTGKEGVFKYDSSDTTSSDNTGTVIVTSSSARYKRVEVEEILSSWFDNTNTGFQNFINSSIGRIGIINNNFSLTSTITMDSGSIIQRKGTTVTTSAAVGFLWTRKKNFHAIDWNMVSTNSTAGNTLLKMDGLWNATFDTCVFTIGNANVDVIQMLPGNSGDIWGTYFIVFNNMKTSGSRYICKADGMSSGQPYITHAYFNNCWATGGVSYIKGSYIDSFNFHKSCADSLSGHAFDFISASNCFLETNEVTPGVGFFTLNEDTTSNKNLVIGARVTDFTSNNDVLGWTPDSFTLQGGNINSDNFKTRLKSVFSYAGSLFLQGKGGTNTWTNLITWSETIGILIKSGYDNFIRFKEKRISYGENEEVNQFYKTMSVSENAVQDVVYMTLNGNNRNAAVNINLSYLSTDNTVICSQEISVVLLSNGSGVLTYDFAVKDKLIIGSNTFPLISVFPNTTTLALIHTNINFAATLKIKVTWSGSPETTIS